jgi:hypothetical protein
MQEFSAVDPTLRDLVASVFAKYPALAKHANDFAVVTGKPMAKGTGQLESYPPEELFNPIPGKATTELYNTTVPRDAQAQLITGDMLHRLGAIDAQTGQPVDAPWLDMKSQLLGTLTPQQEAMSRANYEYYKSHGWNGTFEDFLNKSQGDEFIMGSLTPDKGDYWRGRPGTHQQSTYTPEQDTILNQMRHYLLGQKVPQ